MRILIFGNLAGLGGTETHIINLSNLLLNNQHEVLLAPIHSTREMSLRLKAIGLRQLTNPFGQNSKQRKLAVAAAIVLWALPLFIYKPDVILSLEFTNFLKYLRLFVGRGRTIYIRWGSLEKHQEHWLPHVSTLLNGVIAETMIQAQAFTSRYPDIPTLAIPHLHNVTESIPLRQNHPDPNKLIRVAFLGRYNRPKGIYNLIEIWKCLTLKDVRLDFYGHGPEKETLKSEINENGLQATVEVHDGWSSPDELKVILQHTDLVVLPSHGEGLPLTLLEAMAFGIPFVATDVGAVRTLADDNPDVRVVPLDNQLITAAIEEMVQAIRHGTINSQRLQQYYRHNYAFDKLSQAWLDAIENAASWTR